MIVEEAVRQRYSAAANQAEASLCCAVTYDPKLLEVIPREIIERDYGCGDPSRHVGAGETVLDLGSGTGKICYIVAQIVGASGRVIGVDCNSEMLSLARSHRAAIGDRLGYHNVEFRRGRIQDLCLDLDLFDRELAAKPIRSADDWLLAEETAARLRRTNPLISDESVDVVVSNCVLNLVTPEARHSLFREIHRVLKPGGRAVISDIVSNRDVPRTLRDDPELWSGCVSGAFREDRFAAAFLEAGLSRVETLSRQSDPWRVVEEIEFRSVTIRAIKPATLSSLSVLDVLAPLPAPGTTPESAAPCCGPSGCCP